VSRNRVGADTVEYHMYPDSHLFSTHETRERARRCPMCQNCVAVAHDAAIQEDANRCGAFSIL